MDQLVEHFQNHGLFVPFVCVAIYLIASLVGEVSE